MKYTFFYEKKNMLMIKSNQLLPDTHGMSFKDHCKAYDEAFKMDRLKRLELYACEECKKEVAEQLKLHKDCKIGEFDNI